MDVSELIYESAEHARRVTEQYRTKKSCEYAKQDVDPLGLAERYRRNPIAESFTPIGKILINTEKHDAFAIKVVVLAVVTEPFAGALADYKLYVVADQSGISMLGIPAGLKKAVALQHGAVYELDDVRSMGVMRIGLLTLSGKSTVNMVNAPYELVNVAYGGLFDFASNGRARC